MKLSNWYLKEQNLRRCFLTGPVWWCETQLEWGNLHQYLKSSSTNVSAEKTQKKERKKRWDARSRRPIAARLIRSTMFVRSFFCKCLIYILSTWIWAACVPCRRRGEERGGERRRRGERGGEREERGGERRRRGERGGDEGREEETRGERRRRGERGGERRRREEEGGERRRVSWYVPPRSASINFIGMTRKNVFVAKTENETQRMKKSKGESKTYLS